MVTKTHLFMATAKSSIILALFIVGLSIQSNYADNTYTLVSSYFISLDSLMEVTTKEASRISKLDHIDKLFLGKLNNHPEFEYLMRTNSKGKIISKVSGTKPAPRNYRYIGNQTWHKVMELSKKPYYGNITQRKGYFLFWNRPILVWTKYGSRFGGTVAAKINLHKCFSDIAKKNKIRFQVLYKKRSLFSNLGKDISGPFIKTRLGVYGMPDLILKYIKPGAKPVTTVARPAQQPEEKPALAKEKIQKAPEKEVVKKGKIGKKDIAKKDKKVTPVKKAPPTTKKAEKKAPGLGTIIVLLIVILICAILVVVCIIAMKRAADKRRKIMEAIDKGEI